MKDDLCEIVCIVDRSGSMQPIRKDAIGGFNKFLEDQKKLSGEAQLSLVLFNTEFNQVHAGVPIADVPELTDDTYVPAGMTALLDAVAKTIDEVGTRLAELPEDERPAKVVVCILTDGCENSSREYTLAQVKEKITTQREQWGWEFIYLGANQDAFAEGAKLGVSVHLTSNYPATSKGLRTAYAAGGQMVSNLRSDGSETGK